MCCGSAVNADFQAARIINAVQPSASGDLTLEQFSGKGHFINMIQGGDQIRITHLSQDSFTLRTAATDRNEKQTSYQDQKEYGIFYKVFLKILT